MKNVFVLLILAMIGFSACKKSNTTPTPAATPITVLYEVNLSVAIKDTAANALLKYTDANGQLQTATDFTPGKTYWSKTVTITSSTRPFPLELKTVGTTKNNIYLNAAGNVTAKISVDKSVGAYQSSTTVNGPGYFSNSFALNFTIQ